MTGTLLNVVTVLVGGSLGVLVGNRLPARARETIMHGIGLATLVIGMQLALGQLAAAETTLERLTFIVALASVLGGGLLGEWLDLEGKLDSLGRRLQDRLGRVRSLAGPTASSSTFSQGFVTASLVFCVGPMTLLGALQDGLSGDYTLLAIKSTLDGFTALAFASSLGSGVLFSALTILFYQGALALSAGFISAALSEAMIAVMSATGGILILGIGLGLLEIKRVRVGNLLPAILIAPFLVALALPLAPLFG